MNAATDVTTRIDDLAAHWTIPTLEALKAAGLHQVSVDMEIETFRVLKRVLQSELRSEPLLVSTRVSLTMLMERVLRRAGLLISRRFEPATVNFLFKTRLRRTTGERRAAAAERGLYEEIIQQPALYAFKPPSRTDFTPRLRLSAVAAR